MGLLLHSSTTHGYSNTELQPCNNGREFLWIVDEGFNVIVSPKWEVPHDPEGDAELWLKELQDDLKNLRHDEYRATVQQKTREFFRKTTHGDLVPGDTPVHAATLKATFSRHPKTHPKQFQAKAFEFASGFGHAMPRNDHGVRGRFRGPARASGELVGCEAESAHGIRDTIWYLNSKGSHSLHRVPLHAMRNHLMKYSLHASPDALDHMDGALLQASISRHRDFRMGLDRFHALENPEHALTMEQFCLVAGLLGLPRSSTLFRLAGYGGLAEYKRVSDCGPCRENCNG